MTDYSQPPSDVNRSQPAAADCRASRFSWSTTMPDCFLFNWGSQEWCGLSIAIIALNWKSFNCFAEWYWSGRFQELISIAIKLSHLQIYVPLSVSVMRNSIGPMAIKDSFHQRKCIYSSFLLNFNKLTLNSWPICPFFLYFVLTSIIKRHSLWILSNFENLLNDKFFFFFSN